MKKNLSYFLIGISSFVVFLSSCDLATNNTATVKQCDKLSEDYKNGYSQGHAQAILYVANVGGTSNVETYIQQMNNGNGPIGTISECWKEGYNDGFNSSK
ncbi:hypothetical protein [Ferruginibacter albus]|uniref:hypothetical protein n=1 Tax=Ferruginibacter albus TaxID=2875540 RepID=UPI001CC45CA6|nr:hypothetical protein [Ferruginibacter albus]UAY52743.1 hypothetical protein K9M53_03385 [Ferruginibacter albus]